MLPPGLLRTMEETPREGLVVMFTDHQTKDLHLEARLLELVQEKDLSEGGGAGAGGGVVSQGDQGGSNTMLWKRVRHCVVFGGKIIKPKKEKD